MTDPRWTDETERFVAEAMLAELNAWDGEPDDRAIGMAVTRAVLSAQADAGLLVPPDAVREEQRGVHVESTDHVSPCRRPECTHSGDELERLRVRTVVRFATPWTAVDGSPA